MGYYVRSDIAPAQIWEISETVAVRLGVTNPEQGPGCYFKAEPGETIWDAIKRYTPWFEPDGRNPFVLTALGPGQYFPRIARPAEFTFHNRTLGWYPNAKADADKIALARVQLITLARQLDRICQTIHPSDETFRVYGHDIRNLLILACTEVESHWRAVLTANGLQKDHYSTQDYVRLQDAMKLDEYAISFPNYPWLEQFQPFRGWKGTKQPTKDLRWYDAYNAVKHAREAHFEKGNLHSLFDAISAVAVMIAAQFGIQSELGKNPELQSYFHFSAVPSWTLAEIYISPVGTASGEWTPVPFPFPVKV